MAHRGTEFAWTSRVGVSPQDRIDFQRWHGLTQMQSDTLKVRNRIEKNMFDPSIEIVLTIHL